VTHSDAEGKEGPEEVRVAIGRAWASCAQQNAAGPIGHEAERHEVERHEVVEKSTEALRPERREPERAVGRMLREVG